MDKEKYTHHANQLKVLAHPSRLFIVDFLQSGEKCVCEINKMIDADVSTISKHLKLMKNAGAVLNRQDGWRVYYRLNPEYFKQLSEHCNGLLSKMNGEDK